MKNEKLLKQARDDFKDSETAEVDNRDTYVRDTNFEDGSQWTDDDLALRAGRPCVTVNKIAGATKQIVGAARRNRPRCKVRPVDSQSDPATAELYTGIIRNIENVSDAESAYDTGFECAVRGGYGYWRILTQYADDAAFDQDIVIERIVNPNSVYMDQSSTKTDYSDGRYGFIVETMTEKVFKKEYPKAQPVDWDRNIGEEESDWFAAEKVRVAEYFYKQQAEKEVFELLDGKTVEVKNAKTEKKWLPQEGGAVEVDFVYGDGLEPTPYKRSRKVKYDKVMWCKLTGSEVLEGPKEWPGKYIPIIPCLGDETWLNGKRILRSAVRHAIDAQKLYNWARSNTVETLALAPKQPYHITPAEIEGHEDQWNNAHLKPQAYRLYNDVGNGRPQPSVPSIPNTGAYREAMVSSDDIKATTGIYDASLGAGGNETSGKAITSRKMQGDTATFVYVDNQARAIMYTAKVLVDLIPKIYDSERIIRLLNEDGKEAWAAINKIDPVTGQIHNDMTTGRYDVVFEAGADYATRRQESADGMATLAQTAPQYGSVLIPKIAKNLDWPGADKLGDELAAMNQPQSNPTEEMKIQADVEIKKLEVEMARLKTEGQNIELEKKKIDFQIARENLGGKGLDNLKKIQDIKRPQYNTG